MTTEKITRPVFQFVIALISLLVLPAMTGCKKYKDFVHHDKPEVTVGSNDPLLSSPVIHFSSDTVYVLAASLNRDSGQTLNIDAGTLIKINDRISINIRRGAVINANGTAAEPIVFTSSAPKGGVGVGSGAAGGEHYWYGIRWYGNAATTGAGSGSLSFARIEFAGGNEGSLGLEDALPALLLQDLSSASTLHDIEISYSFEVPSFEFSGGDLNTKDLVSYAGVSVDFYLRHGYHGKMQNLLAYRHPYFAATSGLKGTLSGITIEDSLSHPVISNLSVLGPGPQQAASPIYKEKSDNFGSYRVAALVTTQGARFSLSNSVILGFPFYAWFLDDRDAAASLAAGISRTTYSYFQSDDTTQPFFLDPGVFPPFNSGDFKSLVLNPSNHNRFVGGFDASGLDGALNYDTHPDPVPAPGSALLSSAVFEGEFSDSFFDKVSYVGAAGSDSWLNNWTNFIPLQTDYNR